MILVEGNEALPVTDEQAAILLSEDSQLLNKPYLRKVHEERKAKRKNLLKAQNVKAEVRPTLDLKKAGSKIPKNNRPGAALEPLEPVL